MGKFYNLWHDGWASVCDWIIFVVEDPSRTVTEYAVEARAILVTWKYAQHSEQLLQQKSEE